jgi:hypothetical protein
MKRARKNDIRIGDNKWIEWVSTDGHQNSAVEIDDLIDPMNDFWNRLQTECIAECCGIDAFDLLPGNIKRAAVELSDSTLLEKVNRFRERVETANEQVFVSHQLNSYFHRNVLLQLIDHILAHITV